MDGAATRCAAVSLPLDGRKQGLDVGLLRRTVSEVRRLEQRRRASFFCCSEDFVSSTLPTNAGLYEDGARCRLDKRDRSPERAPPGSGIA